MNTTINEIGERIIAIGATSSHARNESIYVNTLPKLLNRIANTFTGKTSLYKDLEQICEDCNVKKEDIIGLIKTAFFFDENPIYKKQKI